MNAVLKHCKFRIKLVDCDLRRDPDRLFAEEGFVETELPLSGVRVLRFQWLGAGPHAIVEFEAGINGSVGLGRFYTNGPRTDILVTFTPTL